MVVILAFHVLCIRGVGAYHHGKGCRQGCNTDFVKKWHITTNGCNTDFVEEWHINNSFREVQFCNLRYVPENLCTKFFPFGQALCVLPVSARIEF